MLNLLFITDNPKVDHIKTILQPTLKVIIDVVTDFDHGLKDVFEKRPSTVCIQDQIGGVTGESVARHIQMLLGSGAPTFILLHTGNDKARTIKGLFEHIIDLNQSDEVVTEYIVTTLKQLLGTQWDKIYIPPKQSPAPAPVSVVVPEEPSEDTDKLVDDFFSDLGTPGFSTGHGHPSPFTTVPEISAVNPTGAFDTPSGTMSDHGTAEYDRAQSINEDLAELLLLEASKAHQETRVLAVPSVETEPDTVVSDSVKPAPAKVTGPPPVVPEPVASAKPSPKVTHQVQPKIVPLPRMEKPVVEPAPRVQTSSAPGVKSAAAEFRISHDAVPDEEQIPEYLLHAFEENYQSEPSFVLRAVVIVLVCLICAAGGWYVVTQKPQVLNSLKQRFAPSQEVKQIPVAVPTPPPAPKPVPPSPVPQPVVPPSLPTFIPKDGHDAAFAAKNPGWERYVGKHAEFRVFSAAGRVQAVQVLAVKESPISESLLNSVLQEVAGSSKFRVTSRSKKAGVSVENGRIRNKSDVMIYRKNGAVRAFVVSVN